MPERVGDGFLKRMVDVPSNTDERIEKAISRELLASRKLLVELRAWLEDAHAGHSEWLARIEEVQAGAMSEADKMWEAIVPKLRKKLGFGPLTEEEAAAAYRDAPAEPLSEERINEIVEMATEDSEAPMARELLQARKLLGKDSLEAIDSLLYWANQTAERVISESGYNPYSQAREEVGKWLAQIKELQGG